MKERPWSWRQAVAESTLPSTTKHVLLTLSLFVSDVGEGVFPSVSTLVRLTSLARNTVREHLRLGQERGWLDKQERFSGNGRQTSNLWIIKHPKDKGPSIQLELEGGGSTDDPLTAESRDGGSTAGGDTTLNRQQEQTTLLSDGTPPDGREGSFERTWARCRRGSKMTAWNKYKSLVPSVVSAAIIDAGWKALVDRTDQEEFVPHMTTWLNREGWKEHLPARVDDGAPVAVGSPEWYQQEEDRINALS